MTYSGVIYKNLIFLDEVLDQKEKIIDFIINKAIASQFIDKGIEFKKAVISREEEISTSIGFNIAMPHGKSEEVTHPFVAFLRTREAIQWDEDGDDVRMIFLIAVPNHNEDNIHLKLISQISKKLLDEDFRRELLTEKDEQKVYELLKAINQ